MKKPIKINQLKLNVCLLAILATQYAHAAPVVDSGAVQRDIENLNTPNIPPVSQPLPTEEALPKSDVGITVEVTGFQFVGANLLSDAALQVEVQPYIGQTLDYDALNKVAQKINKLYQQNGWLAKVYLPPQDIQNGLVTIEINEAKLGEVGVNVDENARVKPDFAIAMLANVQQKGAPVSSKALERAMLLINDTPGYSAQATLSAGEQTAETDITLNLKDKPLINGNVSVDNYGSRLLGKARLNGLVSLNNPIGWGDQLIVNAMVSRGVDYLQASYEFPVGYSGTRINLGVSASQYEVSGGGLSALKPEGEADAYKLGIKHPIVRSRYYNLGAYATAEAINSRDEVLNLEISDKEYRALTIGLRGDVADTVKTDLGILGLGISLGSGIFWGGVSITSGDLDLSDNASDLAADSITQRSDGRYNKVNFYVGRQQNFSDKLSGKVLFSGQLADENLGGYEKFSLGGPAGLNGFTVGEAAADQGWMLNTEARYAVTPQFSASLLADAGGVCQYKDTWAGWNAGNPKQENCYQLASAGFGLGYTHQMFDARLSYARQISSNRGLDSNGNDIEGENRKHQLWLQISGNF